MEEQGLPRFVRRGLRSTSNDPFDQMALADTCASVDDKDAQPVFGLFQHVAGAVESSDVSSRPSLHRISPATGRNSFRLPVLWIGKIRGAMPLGAGQAFEIGERLADEQPLETTISTPVPGRSASESLRWILALKRDVLSHAYEVRRPSVDTRQALERLERIGEELKICKLPLFNRSFMFRRSGTCG